MNKNLFITNEVTHYMLQPGDGTCYRFWIEKPPFYPGDAYIMGSGLGNDPQNYVYIGIDMPGGCGYGCLMINHLEDDRMLKIANDYLASHGWQNVDPYTSRAVILAASILVFDSEAIEEAAEKMLKASEPL
jgi:hypothetical protein